MSGNDIVAMEYEAQVMLSEKEYELVMNAHKKEDYKPEDYLVLINTNMYFDTPDKYLINHQMVLRMRLVDNGYQVVTLKVELPEGVKEINYKIEKRLDGFIHFDFEKDFPLIDEALKEKGVDSSKIRYITTLICHRVNIKKEKYELFIDKNEYGNIVDYNLEVEAKDRELAHHYLKEEMDRFSIKEKGKYIVKSKRAVLAIK